MRAIIKGSTSGILIGTLVAAGCASQPQPQPAPEVRQLEASSRSQDFGIFRWSIETQGKDDYDVTAFDAAGQVVGTAQIRIDPFMQHEVRVTTPGHSAYQAIAFEGRGYRFTTGVDGREMVLSGSLDDETHNVYIEVPGRSDKLALYDATANMIDKEEVLRFVDSTGLPELAGTDAAIILQQLGAERDLFNLFQPEHESSFEDGHHPERDLFANMFDQEAQGPGDIETRQHGCFWCEPWVHLVVIGALASKCWATCPFLIGKICCAVGLLGDAILIATCLYSYFNRITNCNGHTCSKFYHSSAATLYNGNECMEVGHTCCCNCVEDRCQEHCEAEAERCQLGQGPGEEVHGDCGEAEMAGGVCEAPCKCSFSFQNEAGQMIKCNFQVTDGAGLPGIPGGPPQPLCVAECAL